MQLNLHDLINLARFPLQTPTQNVFDRLAGSVAVAVTKITDGLKALIETNEGLRCQPAVLD